MHSANDVMDQFEYYQSNLKKRGFDISELDKVMELNKQRKNLTTEVETLRSHVKAASKEIGMLKKSGEDATSKMEEVGRYKSQIEIKNNLLDEVQTSLATILACLMQCVSRMLYNAQHSPCTICVNHGTCISPPLGRENMGTLPS